MDDEEGDEDTMAKRLARANEMWGDSEGFQTGSDTEADDSSVSASQRQEKDKKEKRKKKKGKQ